MTFEEVPMVKPVKGRGSDQFVVRFPEGMRDRIAEVAQANGRSMNSEIIARLEASFENKSTVTFESILEMVANQTGNQVTVTVTPAKKK
jgi:hypothetical protein